MPCRPGQVSNASDWPIRLDESSHTGRTFVRHGADVRACTRARSCGCMNAQIEDNLCAKNGNFMDVEIMGKL